MKAWRLRKRSFWNFQSYDSCKQTILELQKTLRSSLVNLTLVMNTIFKQTQVMTKLCWQDKIVVWWSKFKFSNGKYIPKSHIFLCEFNWRNNPNSTSYPLSEDSLEFSILCDLSISVHPSSFIVGFLVTLRIYSWAHLIKWWYT